MYVYQITILIGELVVPTATRNDLSSMTPPSNDRLGPRVSRVSSRTSVVNVVIPLIFPEMSTIKELAMDEFIQHSWKWYLFHYSC